MTFGVAACLFAAVQALQQTATNFRQEYPLASPHVQKAFYVNDCLVGADTTQEAAQLQQQLRAILLKGGFNLCKWRSSSTTVIDSIPKELHEPSQVKSLTDEDTTQPQKALSMFWDTHKDLLFISVGKITNQASTKRMLVSNIARNFDVLGWLSPSTILMKILFQQLWELELHWDDEVSQALQDKHQLWRSQLPLFKNFPFSRCYDRLGDSIQHSELHSFSDASEDAYAAVVYLRTVYTTGSPTMSVVAAKTQVPPVKRQSIPRLELCGAYLLAKLITQ